MDWSKEIKELREYLCVSQNDLARILRVSFVSVNRRENGHFEPTLTSKRRIKYVIKNKERYYELIRKV